MQLRDFLNKGGAEKLNVVAISWTEGRYGNPSEIRLRRMVNTFHPAIRVIRASQRIERDFAPLAYVPVNFVFDGQGRRVFGEGQRHFLSNVELTRIVDSLK